MSHAESLAAQRHADELLFLDWMDERAEGILTGKLFEYLASGRPILSVGSRANTEAAGIIVRTQAGAVACTAEEVRDHLLTSRTGRCGGQMPTGIERFSRPALARELLEQIRVRLARQGAG